MEKRKIDLKDLVKSKYGEIAMQSKSQNQSSCCGIGSFSCSGTDYSVFSDSYSKIEGYNPDADLGLGCGLPTEFANIQKGDSVLDLGSGAGNDVFVARSLTGDSGKVTGLDFTNEMLLKANENKKKLGYVNVEFVKGDIEEMPFEGEQFDVIVSNCVLNLVPDKTKAFSEIFRVLKKRGHFCISDVVLEGELPDKIKNDMAMYAGCVSGAVQKEEYLQIIRNCGFENIQIKKSKQISVPDNILLEYISKEELEKLRKSGTGIFSITVVAEKPNGLINNYNFNPEG
jgi:arsenite methyltransferase